MIATLIFSTIAMDTKIDAVKLESAVKHLRSHVHAGRLPGANVYVSLNNQKVLETSVGYSNLESKSVLKSDSIFQVMSMTKPVTAAAAMVALEKGFINLDDPIEKYLPQFKDIKVKTSNGELIDSMSKPNIRQLMMHTSGLSSDDPGGMSDDDKFLMTLEEYSSKLGTEPLINQPGTTIRYSGVGFSTLASIIEKASGVPFDVFVSEHIFRPLKMNNTYFFLPKQLENKLASVYTSHNGHLTPFIHNSFRPNAKFANGAGGLYSTSNDMAKFINSFSNTSNITFLSKPSIKLMTSLQTGQLLSDGNDARGYGLGWSIIRNPGGQTTLRNIGSFGHTGAFGTEYWHDPSTGLTVVFLAQTFFVPEDPRKQFSTMVNASLVR